MVKARRSFGIVLVGLLVIGGIVGSFLEAGAVAHDDAGKTHQAFLANAAEIASTLRLALLHEQDLTIAAGAFLTANPDITQTQFLAWVRSERAFTRFPELQTISELQLITPAELPAFAARQEADPNGTLSPDGTFKVTPPGVRPSYCLSSVGEARHPNAALPSGLDYCKTVLGTELVQSRASGRDEYLPYKLGKTEELAVGSAIYRGGVVPATKAGRQANFIGWTGTAILPQVVLATALGTHSTMGVAFVYGTGKDRVTFKAGRTSAHAQTTALRLSNGWHVTVFTPATNGSLWSNRSALGVFLGGSALCLLLGLLFYVLTTSRSRALELVAERTNELRHQAYHDSLTGLPNRALILDRIDQMLTHAREGGRPVAALFLDLDNFKDINDTLGHRAGDQLLAAVGSRLADVLRDNDIVGRLGGDEFIMLTEGVRDGGAARVAQRILGTLDAPFEIPGSDAPLTVTASIGVATGDRATPEELLRDADVALYRAKGAGKHRMEMFTPEMLESVDEGRALDVDLHAALDRDQFFLLYQPTVDLATGAMLGVEALLRWHHPVRGIVQPDAFIPALEASGLIIPVGQWVLETACAQGARWQSEGHRLVVSANLAATQLQRDRVVDDVYGALSVSGFDPSLLLLELTESALMPDVDISAVRLQLLKALGVRLAIDDFGTGFSSLAYLQQFPIDVLKIDGSFVRGITETAKSAAIVRTFVQLGRALNLEIIAEGVESDEQRTRLLAERVDLGQGFFFSTPLEADSIDRLLAGSRPVSG
jgi:diguanylate cyclase (GGDEF)-like protein